MRPSDSKIAYIVMLRFLQKMWERTAYEDLLILLDGMCLSLDGKRSMGGALVSDWEKATGGKAMSTMEEGFGAARAFLRYWYEIGPQEEIKNVMDAMETGDGAALWAECWAEVSANVDAGEPFKTAFWYGANAEGKPGRLDRNPVTGLPQFIED